MASINYILQEKENNFSEREISLVIYVSIKSRFQVGSGITVKKANWNTRTNKISVPSVPGLIRDELIEKEELLTELTRSMLDAITYIEDSNMLCRAWAEEHIKRFHKGKRKRNSTKPPIEVKKTLVDYMYLFLQSKKYSEQRQKIFKGIIRSVKRFQLYQKEEGVKSPVLYLDTLNVVELERFRDFLGREHEIYAKYPWIYEQIPYMSRDVENARKPRKTPLQKDPVNRRSVPKQRGLNTISDILTRFRTFFYWAKDAEYTSNNPFKHFNFEEPQYIDPIYPDLCEIKLLYNTDFSDNPKMEIARDTFILQSHIGCRVSDLYSMTRHNIIRGAIEYIPNKTKKTTLKTVRVPLSETAMKIISKYNDPQRQTLLPFLYQQDYNEYIKMAFEKAGINYNVTIIDQVTHQTMFVPISQVVSSHMARRTFVGNLTKKTKQDSIVKELGGFAPNSKAIARYRRIDDDMKREVIANLD